MSERLLGAVVGAHGDDNGLIFPPDIAPIQVVIMPVASHKDPSVNETVNEVAETLRGAGFRIKVDERDIRPGQKYWDWEIKGVPLRLEIGPRDVKEGNAFAARRTGGKSPIPLANISNAVSEQLDIVSSDLATLTSDYVQGTVMQLNDLSEDIIEGHIYEVAFDGSDADAETLEKATGLTILGNSMTPYDSDMNCIVSGKTTRNRQYIARMY